MAIESCRHGKNHFIQIGNGFTMFNSVGDDTKRQCFCFSHGFRTCFAIHHDAGQIRHFGNPTAIYLLFDFNLYLAQNRIPPCKPDSMVYDITSE